MSDQTPTNHPTSTTNGRFKRTRLTMAGVLACALFLSSCASPGVKRLKQPLVGGVAEIGGLLNPNKLAPGTRSLLKEKDLMGIYRNDPAEAISSFRNSITNNGSDADRLAVIELCADHASLIEEGDPQAAVGYYLAAAELSFEAALNAAQNKKKSNPFLAAYNHSAGQVATNLYKSNHDWKGTKTFSGPWKSYRLRYSTGKNAAIDPSDYDTIENTDYIELRHYDIERNLRDGIGASMIVHQEGTAERREVNPFLSPIGMTVPVNAILDFEGDTVDLELTDLLLKEETVVRGRTLPMSADLSVPLAVQASYNTDSKAGFRAMTHPDEYADHSGLYQLEPYRSDQIPVILVHGLMSSPEVWVTALNQLRSDPALVDKYQLMVYRYPSGYPVIYNVASLRKHLKDFQAKHDPDRSNPNMRKMVVIGHSMGGILSNSQIRGSGDAFTGRLFTRPIDDIDGFDAEQKSALKELLIYEANPDISRAIFVAAPHRGADMAGGFVGKLGHSLIKFPRKLVADRPLPEVDGMTDLAREVIKSRPGSLGSLEPDSPVLTAILENPIRKGIITHSIVARQKPHQPLEESSDMAVAYTSAHLDEVVSEMVVDSSNHLTICSNAEAIQEIRRILYLHGGLKAPQ